MTLIPCKSGWEYQLYTGRIYHECDKDDCKNHRCDTCTRCQIGYAIEGRQYDEKIDSIFNQCCKSCEKCIKGYKEYFKNEVTGYVTLRKLVEAYNLNDMGSGWDIELEFLIAEYGETEELIKLQKEYSEINGYQ